jgi:hypothetical protein
MQHERVPRQHHADGGAAKPRIEVDQRAFTRGVIETADGHLAHTPPVRHTRGEKHAREEK